LTNNFLPKIKIGKQTIQKIVTIVDVRADKNKMPVNKNNERKIKISSGYSDGFLNIFSSIKSNARQKYMDK
jgi:hypothetical protein